MGETSIREVVGEIGRKKNPQISFLWWCCCCCKSFKETLLQICEGS